MNATKLAGSEAIGAFLAAGNDRPVKVWRYHHVACPGGETSWGSEEWINDLILIENWETAEWDGSTLELTNGPQRWSLWYEDDPSAGRECLAYLSAHAGFEWEAEGHASKTLRHLLRDLVRWDDESLAQFGLASVEDYVYGDDGGFWVIDNPELFGKVSAVCKEIDRECEEEDRDPEDDNDVAEEILSRIA